MATKDSDKNQWKDPKDFGLPWVEIKPIKEISPIKVPSPKEEKSEIQESIPPVQEKPVAAKSTEPEKEVKKSENKEKPSPKPSPKLAKEEKKSFSWAWVVVILAVAIVGVIIWQMQKRNFEEEFPLHGEIKPEFPAPQPVEIPDSSIQVAEADILQDSQNQESVEKNSQTDLNISKPVESGTTIAQTVKGNLIRIESKAERPQYFIVVGSVPSEQDALKLAAGFQARVPEVFLILPYSESSNYRLAIGKFGSFRSAAEELEKIKSQYTEELWILKY